MNIKNNISWFRGWFIFFSPLIYFSVGAGNSLSFVVINKNDFKIFICKADKSLQSSEATTGLNYSYYTMLLNKKQMIYLDFPEHNGLKTDSMEDYLSNKWAYAHPEESNAGIGLTPEQIADSAKIKVWYHPKSSIAYVISEPKYEKEFPAKEIIWRNLKWFIGFTILPFYFFCRWIIEWIRVLYVKRKLKIQDENIL